MNRSKLDDALQRAEDLGLRVELDSWLLVAKLPANNEENASLHGALEDLASLIGPLRHRFEARTIAARAKELVGSRILFVESGVGNPILRGTLQDPNGLIVSVNNPEFRRPISVQAGADALVFPSHHEAGSAPGPDRAIERMRLNKNENEIGDLLSRGEELGLRVSLDSGLLAVKLPAGGEEKAHVQEVIEKLASRVREVRRFLKECVILPRAEQFIGWKVMFVEKLQDDELYMLEGTLLSLNFNCVASIEVGGDARSVSVENLLIPMIELQDPAAEKPTAPAAESARSGRSRGWFSWANRWKIR